MSSLRVPSLSTEYVKTQISYRVEDSFRDPTAFAVHWAFTLGGVEPDDSEWVQGSWETAIAGGKYFARVLIGPQGDVTLDDGVYTAWVRVTGSPEVPVKLVGRLAIT